MDVRKSVSELDANGDAKQWDEKFAVHEFLICSDSYDERVESFFFIFFLFFDGPT